MPVAAAFDLDGVLVDSEVIKIGAWTRAVREVLRPSREVLDDLDGYNRAHRGVPRAEKFAYAAAYVGGDGAAVDDLLQCYARLLASGLSLAPALPGAQEFVQDWPGPRAVVSSAPRREIEEQLHRLSFTALEHIYSGDIPKQEALTALSIRYGGVVFFGDAPADAAAAAGAGCNFVALGPNRFKCGERAVTTAATLFELLPRIHFLAAKRRE